MLIIHDANCSIYYCKGFERQRTAKNFFCPSHLSYNLDQKIRQKEKSLHILTRILLTMSGTILHCDAETIMRRYNNVEVSQCVLFYQQKTNKNYFPSG